MANFKGFKQVSLAEYNAASVDEKKGYLWLVRELSGETVLSSAMYFGTRKYAELNNDDERAANLVASLGSMVKSDGTWDGFLPIEEHEILGEASDASDAFVKLEAAVLALKGRMSAAESAITNVEAAVATKAEAADVTALEGRVSDAEGAITGLAAEMATKADASALAELEEKVDTKASAADVTALEGRVDAAESAITEMAAEVALKANAADVYTKSEVYNKEEVDGKIAGTFKFMGEALRISEDKKKIYVQSGATEVEVVASESNRGHVYQIGDKEYASNGSVWVELGFNIDLSDYAKKEYVDSSVNEVATGLAAEAATRAAEVSELDQALATEIERRQELGTKVDGIDTRVGVAEDNIDSLDTRATFTAQTFDDVVVSAMTNGQIVYVSTDEGGESGRTAGAYIKIGDSLKKLDISSGQGDTPLARIEALETKVGTTVIPESKTISETLVNIITVSGGDVE